MKKKVMVLFLSIVMVMASVLTVVAASDPWSDDWSGGYASAYGSGTCTTTGADADAVCYISNDVGNGTVVDAHVSASFEYRNMLTGVYYSDVDSDDDEASSYASASVGFGTSSNCEGVYLEFDYYVSYTIPAVGGSYIGDYCSGSGSAWAH